MVNMERLDYIDFFRGIALIYMIFWHMFDALARSTIYYDLPYYIKIFNSPTILPPPLIFTFVSGISIYIFIKKRSGTMRKKEMFTKTVKRYGRYILISIPFTIFMFGLATYLQWDEAIQGIGLSAIFAALIVIFLIKHEKQWTKIFWALIIVLGIARVSLLSWDLGAMLAPYPAEISLATIPQLAMSTFFSAMFRGWFAVLNLLPLMLGGILFLKLFMDSLPLRKIFLIGLVPLVISLIIHAAGYPIDYYGRSFSFTIFAIGLSSTALTISYYIFGRAKRFLMPVSIMGLGSLEAYLFHFIFIVKPIYLLGANDKLPDGLAALFVIPLTIFVYYVVKFLLRHGRKPQFYGLTTTKTTTKK
jgi:uncharacterized membrane protein